MSDGAELRGVLRELGWSQAKLGRKVDVSPGTVYNWTGDRQRLPGAVKAYLNAELKFRRLRAFVQGLTDG